MTAAAKAWVIVLILGGLLSARRARADEPWFVWDAPRGCPGRDDVLARIDALTSSSAPGPAHEISFEAFVQQLGEGSWSLRVVRRSGGERHTRVLRGESCEAVAEAASVVVALALREARSNEPNTQPPPANVSTGAALSQGPATRGSRGPAAVRAPQPHRRRPVPLASAQPRVLLRTEAGVDWTTLRDTAILFSVVGRRTFTRSFGLEFATIIWLPSLLEVGEVQARVSLATHALRGCYSWGERALVSWGCAAIEGGFTQAYDPDRGSGGFAAWGAVGPRLGLEAKLLGPFRMGIAAEALVPLVRPEIRDGRHVYALDKLASRGWLAVGLEVP